jgi:hypothetical protein
MSYDPDITYHNESRAFERAVRAVCGGAFGVIPGLWLAAELGTFDGQAVAGIVGVTAAACAFLAQRYGDRFWHKAADVIRAIF